MDCALGDLCNPFDCSGAASEQRELLGLPATTSVDVPRSLQASCISEGVRAYTACVIRECPTADAVCTGSAPDGDTCADVQAMCQKITSECCPPCGNELNLLLDCSTGELCDPFDCGPPLVQPQPTPSVTPPPPTPTVAPPTAPTSAAGPKQETMSAVVVAVAAGLAALV
jgi:hypothetical protein